MYGYYILIAPPLLLAHANLRDVPLRPACVTLYKENALLIEPEQPINDSEMLLTCGSYRNVNVCFLSRFHIYSKIHYCPKKRQKR